MRNKIGSALVVAGAFFMVAVIAEFCAVDRCLDRGGSFDYDGLRCDFEGSHAGGALGPHFVIVGVGFALIISGIVLRRGTGNER